MSVVVTSLEPGDGETYAKINDKIHAYYRGTLANGKEFDSKLDGEPFVFTLGKRQVIRGWEEAFDGKISLGEKAKIEIPSVYGYGIRGYPSEDGNGFAIPPDSDLTFEVTFVKLERDPKNEKNDNVKDEMVDSKNKPKKKKKKKKKK